MQNGIQQPVLITGSRLTDATTQHFVERQVRFWNTNDVPLVTGDNAGVEQIVRRACAPALLTVVGSGETPPARLPGAAVYIRAQRADGETRDEACLRTMLALASRVVVVTYPHDKRSRAIVLAAVQADAPLWVWMDGDYINPAEIVHAAAQDD